MKSNKLERKNYKKTILAAAIAIGTSTLVFQGFTQAATAAEFKKTSVIPTNYANYTTFSSKVAQNSLPEGYKKANYKVGTINLEYYHKQKPTIKDMRKEDAAEIGAQALWKIFGLSLEGQMVEMGYQQATENLPRSNWYADVLINGERSYSFSVDSVTGELFSIGRGRTLKENVSLAFDATLAKNPQEYIQLAKKMAEKYNVVHSPIKSVEYNCQGYSDNDPTISFDIAGENGEIALMTFSRYDKALLGIGYNTEYRSLLESMEKYNKKVEEMAKKLNESTSPASKNQSPTLKSLQ